MEKSIILEMLSNMVFSSKNVKLSVVKEFFFARFLKILKKKLDWRSTVSSLRTVTLFLIRFNLEQDQDV